LILLAALGFGCGGGETATVSSFCEQLAAKECGSKAATNCNVAAAACKTTRMAACTAWTTTVQAAFPTTRSFTSGNIGACLNKVGAIYDKSPIAPADKAEADDACQRVFSGSKKKNEVCASDYECGSGLICDPTFLVCAQKTSVQLKAQDPCGGAPGAYCSAGLYCSMPAGLTLKVCVAKKAMGEVCDAANPCAESLRCDAATATCKKRADINEACTTDSDCLPTSPYCDPYFTPLTCDVGFIPARLAPECKIFGATSAGAGGAAGGASGSVGGAAGGASGSVGGAAGGDSGSVGGAAGGASGGLTRGIDLVR